ncbi:MAG: helix-turn-helix domain-containing protein [Lentisphaeria bacterium]|nr:helix-turn-helix domain-containing protein [Lentisphaeria bacterium]
MIRVPINQKLQQNFYFFHHSVFTPGSFYPLHDHDFCEFFIVSQGTLKHIFNGKAYICPTGTICFLNPEDSHELHCIPECAKAEILNCNVLSDEVRRLFRYIAGESPTALEDCVQHIFPVPNFRQQALLEEMQEIFHCENEILKKARLRLVLENILLMMISSSGFSADSAPDWLRNARTAMREPDNYRIGLKRFIELAGHTQEHLCRAMRRYYSETPQQWLTSIRLEAVFDRLLRHGGNISAAAFEEGFNNLAWFRKAFRQRYGVSPKTIRKKR